MVVLMTKIGSFFSNLLAMAITGKVSASPTYGIP
jgi:hypothetical protein